MNSYTKVLLATDFSEAASTLPDCLFALCPDIETEVILVHFLTEDEQCTAAQASLETLAAKILEQEHKALPEALSLWAAGRLAVQGRKVTVTN